MFGRTTNTVLRTAVDHPTPAVQHATTTRHRAIPCFRQRLVIVGEAATDRGLTKPAELSAAATRSQLRAGIRGVRGSWVRDVRGRCG
jgi:hypothetical protein